MFVDFLCWWSVLLLHGRTVQLPFVADLGHAMQHEMIMRAFLVLQSCMCKHSRCWPSCLLISSYLRRPCLRKRLCSVPFKLQSCGEPFVTPQQQTTYSLHIYMHHDINNRVTCHDPSRLMLSTCCCEGELRAAVSWVVPGYLPHGSRHLAAAHKRRLGLNEDWPVY